MAPGCGTQK